MCLLMLKPEGVKLNREHLHNASLNNPDGMGVAYVKDGKLHVDKGWFNFDNFFAFLLTIEEHEMMIHFRAASAGMDTTKEMTHPFEVVTDLFFLDEEKKQPRFFFAIAHNGRLDWRSTKTESDTYCFIEDILAPQLRRDPWFLDHKPGRTMLARTIKDTNKMVIMKLDAKDGKFYSYVINDDGGWGTTSSGHSSKAHWIKDTQVWYSNYSYEAPKPKVTTVYPSQASYAGSHAMGGYYGSGMLAGMGGDGEEWETIAESQSPFAKPDENGWKWDFRLDKWKNVRTGVVCDHLESRPVRPQYMVLRERNKALAQLTTGSGVTTPGKHDQANLSVGDKAELNKDDDLLSEEEWKKKHGFPKVVQLEGGLNISVPRDADVEFPGDASKLTHLNKFEKKILRRAAADYVKDTIGGGKKKNIRLSNAEMIAWLRSDLRDMIPDLKQLNDEELDKWIVAQQRSGAEVRNAMETAQLSGQMMN